METNPVCSVEGCERSRHCRGFCQAHYVRVWKYGDPGSAEITTPVPTAGLCSSEGCERQIYAKGFCSYHYNEARAGRPTDKLPGSSRRTVCSVEGCDEKHKALGYCKTHYARLRRTGSVDDRPYVSPGSINSHGYREVQVNRVRMLEHRHVMAELLGRPLARDENVHHINGDRADNRPDNLELWSTSQPSGQRVADKIEWAKAFLARYTSETPGSGGPGVSVILGASR